MQCRNKLLMMIKDDHDDIFVTTLYSITLPRTRMTRSRRSKLLLVLLLVLLLTRMMKKMRMKNTRRTT